ncbi:MAG: HSP90 family protein [Actinobacteria bacterium HGW-Actinobacteria-4]|nr:MAG: HSP90 family protein [Actinobacteria bacterium HGW-Actinobacteria-4]
MSEPVTVPFQVDLRGVVDLLSRSIYSTPRVFLRELLQNGRDAIAARALHELRKPEWGIRIVPLGGSRTSFVMHDDGIGLTLDEVNDVLATVGRSSKRDLFDMPRDDFLGQFGIGLLSCFMVSDVITIRSRSAKGGLAVEWVGYSDGHYSVRELDEEVPVGTSVYLAPRPDREKLLQVESVVEDVARFGEFLPVPVRVDLPQGDPMAINRDAPFLEETANLSAGAMAYGAEMLAAEPLDMIPIDVPATGTRGVVYVLPFSPALGARQASRVYLGQMLLGDSVDGLLPDWAFFTRAVVNSTGLNPTASREDLVQDDALSETREAIAEQIRGWILEASVHHPLRLEAVIGTHHLALKALTIHDDDLVRYVAPHLSVETNLGHMTLESLAQRTDNIRYTASVDEFRQLLPVLSDGDVVVNGGYTYDSEVVEAFARRRNGLKATAVDVVGEIKALAAPALDDRDATTALAARAERVLADVGVEVVVRSVGNPEVSSMYVVDPALLRAIDRGRARDGADALWGGVLSSVDEFLAERTGNSGLSRPTLLVNWESPLVRSVSRVDDPLVFDRAMHVVYVQALMAGHHPLTPKDRGIMNRAFGDLLALSVASSHHDDREETL